MRILYTILLLFIFKNVHANHFKDSIIIMGNIVDFDSALPIAFCKLQVNNSNTLADENGNFLLKIERKSKNKNLKIRMTSVGYKPFYILFKQNIEDTIDFKTIKIPTYTKYDDFQKVLVKGRAGYRYSKLKTKRNKKSLRLKYQKNDADRLSTYWFDYKGCFFKLNLKNNCLNINRKCTVSGT